ncbi:MAG: hypothetical protein AAGH64_07230 [Planctomycetota bacterium]
MTPAPPPDPSGPPDPRGQHPGGSLPTFHAALDADPTDGGWTLGVRADPGVVLFETARGEAVTVVAGADARHAVRARLDPEQASGSTKSLIGVAGRIRVRYAHSEAERRLVWLLVAHALLPRLADETAKTPPCWFLRLDARDGFPKGTPIAPRGLSALDDLRGVFGPYPTKKRAGLASESVTDALDLCRHHHLLVLAPDASACAYKDMGRCPAACDGSETMHDYRARVAEAERWLGAPDEMRARTEREMREASDAYDFERAGACKATLDRTAPLAEGCASALVGATWAAVAPDAQEARVCVMHVDQAGAWSITNDAPPGDVPRLVRDVRAVTADPPTALGCDLLAWAGGIACAPDDTNTGKRTALIVPSDAHAERSADAALPRAARTPSVE